MNIKILVSAITENDNSQFNEPGRKISVAEMDSIEESLKKIGFEPVWFAEKKEKTITQWVEIEKEVEVDINRDDLIELL